MNIAMISPHNVKCGIFTYSRDLTYALAQQDVETYIIRWPRFGQRSLPHIENIARGIPKKAELIHVQHEYGLHDAREGELYNYLKLHGKPVITTMHAVGNFNSDKTVALLSDKVITHNEFCQRKFSGDSTIIPHGCTPHKPMNVKEAKKIMGIPPNAPIVGYVGFISPYKGIDDLIMAMEPLDAGVVIGGGWHAGPGTEYISTLKLLGEQKLPGRIQWTGFVDHSRLPIVYGCMDLVVVASRFATESGALLTAMGHGKPIIARDLPPFREKGLITFKTVEDLTALIKKILSDPNQLKAMSDKSLTYAKTNSWKNVATKHIELYKEMV